MRHEISEVVFPEDRADRIEGRGITAEDVLEALTASRQAGDMEPVWIGEGRALRGGQAGVYLCRGPVSGSYLHVAIELMEDGTAWCYHAMRMDESDRKRFERAQ